MLWKLAKKRKEKRSKENALKNRHGYSHWALRLLRQSPTRPKILLPFFHFVSLKPSLTSDRWKTIHKTMVTFRSSLYRNLRSFSTSTRASHHKSHQQTHQYSEPSSFIGSWEAPSNPKEAEAKLAQLRRDYAKQVKEIRKDFIKEVELMRLEKLRKDEARREALRLQNEERKRLKAEAAKVRAQQRQVAEEEFRQTLVRALCPSISNLLCFCALVFFFWKGYFGLNCLLILAVLSIGDWVCMSVSSVCWKNEFSVVCVFPYQICEVCDPCCDVAIPILCKFFLYHGHIFLLMFDVCKCYRHCCIFEFCSL